MHRVVIIVAAAAALVAAAQQASAASADDGTVSIRVPVADLDLQHADGARVMLARLTMASRDVCGSEPRINDLGRSAIYRECVSQTLANAVQSLNAPMVTAAFKGEPASERMASVAPER